MPSTTNFGWTTPADTDLVKDGASAIRTLGNGVDASFVDLKGGTTGQILSKATNADLDFTWVTSAGDIEGVSAGVGISGGGTSGTVTITNSMATTIDAKADLIVGTGADTFDRLAVGANNTVLTADSSTTTGLKWATPAGGKIAQVVSATITTQSQTTSTTYVDVTNYNLSITPTNASSKVLVLVVGCFGGVYNGDNSCQFEVALVRGSTTIYDPNRSNWWEENTTTNKKYYSAIPMTYLDSPATTSSTTYKLQMRQRFGGTVYCNDNSNVSTITLLEVLP